MNQVYILYDDNIPLSWSFDRDILQQVKRKFEEGDGVSEDDSSYYIDQCNPWFKTLKEYGFSGLEEETDEDRTDGQS